MNQTLRSFSWALLLGVLVAGPARSQAPQDAAGLRQRLAEIELMVTVDRDFAGAEAALAVLDAARLPKELSAVLAEPDVAATRSRILAAIEAARSDDDTALEESLVTAFKQNDEITLETLGSRAARVLRRSLETNAGPLAREVGRDRCLEWLLRLDESEGWDLLGPDPWRLGEDSGADVLMAVLNNGLRWRELPGRAPIPERPEWLDWLARLFKGPAAAACFGVRGSYGNGALASLVGRLASNEAFTPDLAQALSSLLTQVDGYVCLSVIQALGGNWVESAQPIVERLVVDPRAAVRVAAAKWLVQADFSPGLRSRVADPEVNVRLNLVESLGPRSRWRIIWGGRSEGARRVEELVTRPGDEESRKLLTALAADAEPAVREAVVGVLSSEFDPPLERDVYFRLIADPDVQVRKAMAGLRHPDPVTQAAVMTKLAGDADPIVTQAVDFRFRSAKWDSESTSWLLPTLQARLANTQAGLTFERFPIQALQSAEARSSLTRAALDSGDGMLVSLLARAAFNPDGGPLSNELLDDWARLDGPSLVRLLVGLDEANPAILATLAYSMSDDVLASSVPEALDSLAQDAGRSLALRLTSAAITLHEPNAARFGVLHELLRNSAFQPGSTKEDWKLRLVLAAVSSVPSASRNAAIRDILRDIALSDSLMTVIAKEYDPQAAGGDDLTRLLLDRWMDDDVLYEAVERAIVHLGRRPDLADEETLRRAVHSHSAYHTITAIKAMGRLRNERFLGQLRECLDPVWVSTNYQPGPTDVALAAVEAIQGYMSDEAAAALLEAAASSPSATVREAALLAVEAIGRYRDALAAWQRRTVVGPGRDAAVARLVALVKDASGGEDVRSEAVRALGVLQAVDQMPLIIEALLDKSTGVREAAREALARLNAPAATVAKPEPFAEPEPASKDP